MLNIRKEERGDIGIIRHVNKQAFGQEDEADIIEKLRKRNILSISLVALDGGEIVGHIAFSPVIIESADSSFQAMALGPMSILPEHQRRGIGSRLVRAGLEECRNLGHDIAVLVGHPEYYPRFGFVPARPKGIKCEFEAPDEAWMVVELGENALAGRQGTAIFQPEFRESV